MSVGDRIIGGIACVLAWCVLPFVVVVIAAMCAAESCGERLRRAVDEVRR